MPLERGRAVPAAEMRTDASAGFDLVGEESKGRPLRDFIPQFLDFKKNCKKAKVDIPFLFHCGETLDIGMDTDGNLIDALLLGSKRIGVAVTARL